MKQLATIILVAYGCLNVACLSTTNTPVAPLSQKGSAGRLHNLYEVHHNNLYRSEQPSHRDFIALEKLGIRTVLNLRTMHTDKGEAHGTHLLLKQYKLKAGNITQADLEACVAIILISPRPVLVHCYFGADRTGTVCAAYRIAVMNESPEQVIQDFVHGPYGYHIQYKNLTSLLRSINWKQFRQNVKEQVKQMSQA